MEHRAMTKSDVYRLARSFGTESNRSFAILKKIGSAHIELGLVATIPFLSAYAAETEAILLLDRRRHARSGGRALTFLH
jgi:hypothetical protein